MALSFGLDALDGPLGGGLPVGKLSVLVAPPESQSELLLEQLAGTQETLYVSTNRPAPEVREQLGVDDPDHEPTAVVEVRPDRLVEEDPQYELPSGGVVVVDPINGLEVAERDAYMEFLGELRTAAADAGCAVLLHGQGTETTPHLRPATLARADVVMELRQLFHPRKVESYLTITKHRGGAASPEPIKLILTDEADVDTSRDIA